MGMTRRKIMWDIFDKHGDDEVILEIDSKSGKSKLKKIIKDFKKLCE